MRLLRRRLPGIAAWMSLIAIGLAVGLGSLKGQTSPKSAEPPRMGGHPVITVFADQDVTEGNPCWCAVRGPAGELAIGTDVVAIFDGIRWTRIEVPGSNAVRSLRYASDGRLWVAAANELGFVSRDRNGAYAYHSLAARAGQGSSTDSTIGDLWQVFPRPGGEVYWIGDDRVLCWDGSALRTWRLPGQRRLLGFEYDGEILVHHRSSGLYRLTPQGPELRIPASDLPAQAIIGIEHAGHVSLSIGSLGVVPLGSHVSEAQDSELAAYLHANWVTAYARFGDTLFIGTLNGGIAVTDLQGRILRIIGTEDGLPSRNIYSLSIDSSGILWVGTSTKLVRMDPSLRAIVLDSRDGLSSPLVGHLVRDGGGFITVTDGAVLRSVQDSFGLPARFEPMPGLESRFWDAAAYPDRILLGSLGGLMEWSQGKLKQLYSTTRDVFLVFPSRFTPSRLYLAEGYSLLIGARDQQSGFVKQQYITLPDIVSSMVEISPDKLLIGTLTSGAFLAESKPSGAHWQTTPLRGSSGDGNRGPSFVAEVGDKRFVLGRASAAILADSGTGLTPVRGAPSGDPLAAAASADGDELWAAWRVTNEAGRSLPVFGYFFRNGSAWDWQTVPIPEARTVGSFRSLSVENFSGREYLWIVGADGVLRVDALIARGDQDIPNVRLVSVSLGGSTSFQFNSVTELKLPYSSRPATFEYASPDFRFGDRIEYQTRLDPVSPDWSPSSGSTRREWASLSDGDYLFTVRAIVDGIQGRQLQLRFAIAPPWYRTKAAWLLWLILAAGAVHLIIQVRTRVIRNRNRELATQVHKRTIELERANAAKSEFVASISHEIRNPLNGIVGLTDVLAKRSLPAEAERDLRNLRLCATHLSSLVEDVLDFAKIEAGSISFEPEPIALKDLIDSIRAVVTPMVVEAGMELRVDADADLPEQVVLDARKVRQILINFLSNAVKYAGIGTIQLSARRETGPHDRLVIRFTVTDQGPGVPESERERIFSRFVRGREARRKNEPGAGLGLAVCKSLAVAMAGNVGLECPPEGGAVFYLSIPVDLATQSFNPKQTGKSSMLSGRGFRALIVDDMSYNLDLLEFLLVEWGVEVVRAVDGPSALDALLAQPFDIVFLDIELPGFGGMEVIARYRAQANSADSPWFVATTAYATHEAREACQAAGFSAFITKPVSQESIHSAIAGLGSAMIASNSIRISKPEASAPPAPPPAPNTPLRTMAAGDEARYRELVRKFIADLDEETDAFAEAARAGDFPKARHHAHRLRSHAALVGSNSLSSVAGDAQETAEAADGELLLQLLSQVLEIAESLREQLIREAGPDSSG